jgi:hypothetical protein
MLSLQQLIVVIAIAKDSASSLSFALDILQFSAMFCYFDFATTGKTIKNLHSEFACD